MPYEESWVKTHCEKCEKANWVCDGNMQDLTVADTEAIECWNCGNKWWRDPDYASMMYENEDEDAEDRLNEYAEKGRKSP